MIKRRKNKAKAKNKNKKRSKKSIKTLRPSKVNSSNTSSTVLKKFLEIRIIRFIITGIINTSFSYGIYAFLLYSGLGYKTANLGSMLLGIVFSFKTQGKFVFKNTSNKRFFRFVIAWVFIYVFNIFIIGQFLKLGLNAYISGAIALIPVIIFSYITQRFFVFADIKSLKTSLQN
jgi:putative flippase GtrA